MSSTDRRSPLCLDCADLGHLVFLPAGDAALTLRAKKAGRVSAVVVRWSRSRKRYERQGILAEAIARHAAARGSGRIGRSAAGQALDPGAVRLAVAASVRHIDTRNDELLMSGVDRETARDRVRDRVEDVLSTWRDGADARHLVTARSRDRLDVALDARRRRESCISGDQDDVQGFSQCDVRRRRRE